MKNVDIKHLRWMMRDALTYAIGVSSRCQEMVDGTEAALVFDRLRDALLEFRDSNPEMKALSNAAVAESVNSARAK